MGCALDGGIVVTETVSGSGDQSLPALGAATGDDLAAVGGGHTRTETVGAGAADLAGLVSAFHGGLIGKRSQSVRSSALGVKPKKGSK